MEQSENVTRDSPNVSIPADADAEEGRQFARDLRRQSGLVHDNRVSFRIPTNEDAKIHVHDMHGHESWRAKILYFLHQPSVQWTLIALLLLDVVILFTELYLGAHVSFAFCFTCAVGAL
jgi:membrane-bound ClpP family serine protease